MEIRSYNSELSYANLCFKKLFSNIIIERKKGGKTEEIPVQCIIGNRSRIFKNLENPEKAGNYSLPMIIIQRNGISRNAERLTNLHNEILHSPSSKRTIYDLYSPNPIDIEYTVTVISKYPGDNDMIMGNFIPFFNSDLFVTCIHPKYSNLKFNNQVIMGDSVNEEHPDELGSEVDDVTVTSFTFTYKTYIFGGNKQVIAGIHGGDGEGDETIYDGFVPIISKINLDMHAVPRHDITYPLSVLSTYISTDVVEDPTELNPDHTKVISAEVSSMVIIPYDGSEYAFSKYFKDYDADTFHYYALSTDISGNVIMDDYGQPKYFLYEPTHLRDILRWHIDERGIFTIEGEH